MSAVTAFCQSASSLAAAMRGAEQISIGGGTAIDAVLAAIDPPPKEEQKDAAFGNIFDCDSNA